jgi:hypothetical protein
MVRHLFGVSLIAVLAATPAQADAASTLTTLWNFTGGADGAYPQAGLIFDSTGALYSTTLAGGNATCDCGVVFKPTPPSTPAGAWTESVLHSVRGFLRGGLENNDGAFPEAGLISDSKGALYGTTSGALVNGPESRPGCEEGKNNERQNTI